MALPKEMKAVTYSSIGAASINTIPLPPLRPTYLLIKVHSVALNPTDWKGISNGKPASPFSIVGCDFAGTVIQIGSAVTKPFKIGDEIYGCANGSNFNESYDGVFAEYAMVKGDVAMHAPAGADLDDLSTFPLCSITVGQGLFQPGKGLSLSMPGEGKGHGEWVLIYGGSTVCGTLGIQFAKLAGYKVITTCSPRNNELVKSRGADVIFDYNDPECGAKIRQFTDDKLRYAWDAAGNSKICSEALSSNGAMCHFGCIQFQKFPRVEVKQTMTQMYTMFGETFQRYGLEYPASKEDFEFAKVWMELTENLVKEGTIKVHPKRVESGGLAGVLKGLEELKAGRVSGQKLVYRI